MNLDSKLLLGSFISGAALGYGFSGTPGGEKISNNLADFFAAVTNESVDRTIIKICIAKPIIITALAVSTTVAYVATSILERRVMRAQ